MSTAHDIDFGVNFGVMNKKNQVFNMMTREESIVFSIKDGDNVAEFEVTYNNRVIMDMIKKQFGDCSAHASNIKSVSLRKEIERESNPST